MCLAGFCTVAPTTSAKDRENCATFLSRALKDPDYRYVRDDVLHNARALEPALFVARETFQCSYVTLIDQHHHPSVSLG
jgi:hypothetical protein